MPEVSVDKLLSPQSDFQEEQEFATPTIDTFILKDTSRCNLACRYCYVYEMADQSWRDQPIHMSRSVVGYAAQAVAEYAEAHDLKKVSVVMHGGEPLLGGPEHLDFVAQTFRSEVRKNTWVDLKMQTNGVLLNDEVLDIARNHRIRFGVSLDGDREANDAYRLFRNGRSSFDAVEAGLDALNQDKYRHLFLGILSVVNLGNVDLDGPRKEVIRALESNGLASYEALKKHNPPMIDFLLPHGHHDTPPPGLETTARRHLAPYFRWLKPVYDEWQAEDNYRQQHPGTPGTTVRLFKSVNELLAGRQSLTESIGGTVLSSIVIETNGELQLTDTFKSTAPGEPELGLRLPANTIDQAVAKAFERARSMKIDSLPEPCSCCPVAKVCGAGYPPHRFSLENGFANRSIYSSDLMRLISHAAGRILSANIEEQAQQALKPFIGQGEGTAF